MYTQSQCRGVVLRTPQHCVESDIEDLFNTGVYDWIAWFFRCTMYYTSLFVSHESDLVSTVAAISLQSDRKTISQALDGVATQQ